MTQIPQGVVPTAALANKSEDIAALFKALAHPKRLAILLALRDAEHCVCELEDALDLRQAYVSQQLTVLREVGLVCYRKIGWNVYYRIARPEVYTLLEMASVINGELGTCAVLPPRNVLDNEAAGCEAVTCVTTGPDKSGTDN